MRLKFRQCGSCLDCDFANSLAKSRNVRERSRRSAISSLTNQRLDLLCAAQANQAICFMPILEQDHRRNTTNAEARRDGRVVIYVDFIHLDLSREFLRGRFKDGRHGSARPAPRSPEIYEDGLFGMK